MTDQRRRLLCSDHEPTSATSQVMPRLSMCPGVTAKRWRRRRPFSSTVLVLVLVLSLGACLRRGVAHAHKVQANAKAVVLDRVVQRRLDDEGQANDSLPIEKPTIDAQDYEDVQDYVAAGGVAEDAELAQEETEAEVQEEDSLAEVDEAVAEVLGNPSAQEIEEEGDVASDSSAVEETDVNEAAQELLKEAESDMSVLMGGGDEANEEQSTPSGLSSPASYYSESRSAWVAHGAVGAVVFGLLVPSAISSALFRDLFPAYWIYVHVCINVITFAMTFFTVGIAFATMNGMGEAGEGHMKEVHHIVGLLLLMMVSFQTANGFLRPPREFVTDDEHDRTPGAVFRTTWEEKGMTARTLWHLVHFSSGLFIFALGAYQVQSGLGLLAKRFGTTDWGQVYVGYICWLSAVILIGKLWMMWRARNTKKMDIEIQMGRGSNLYDPENKLTVAQFETV